MNLDIPERPEELRALEKRYRHLREQGREIEQQLQRIETAMNLRHLEGESGDLKAVAEKLAAGDLSEVNTEDLPLQRHELRQRLSAFNEAVGLVRPRLQRARECHAKAVAAAIRPQQRKAVGAIDAALRALLEANKAERDAHDVAPGAPLVACSFPGIDAERVAHWRSHATRNGLLDDEPEPEKPTKGIAGRLVPRRARSNGSAAEPAPLAAKG